MRSFDSKHGYDGTGAKEELIARIQDIKTAPETGKQRLVIREKGKNFSHAVIDIDMKAARDLKEKETYIFHVNEKDHSKNPGHQRRRSAEFTAYNCEERPETYTSSAERASTFSRFGGSGRLSDSKRTKF